MSRDPYTRNADFEWRTRPDFAAVSCHGCGLRSHTLTRYAGHYWCVVCAPPTLNSELRVPSTATTTREASR